MKKVKKKTHRIAENSWIEKTMRDGSEWTPYFLTVMLAMGDDGYWYSELCAQYQKAKKFNKLHIIDHSFFLTRDRCKDMTGLTYDKQKKATERQMKIGLYRKGNLHMYRKNRIHYIMDNTACYLFEKILRYKSKEIIRYNEKHTDADTFIGTEERKEMLSKIYKALYRRDPARKLFRSFVRKMKAENLQRTFSRKAELSKEETKHFDDEFETFYIEFKKVSKTDKLIYEGKLKLKRAERRAKKEAINS